MFSCGFFSPTNKQFHSNCFLKLCALVWIKFLQQSTGWDSFFNLVPRVLSLPPGEGPWKQDCKLTYRLQKNGTKLTGKNTENRQGILSKVPLSQNSENRTNLDNCGNSGIPDTEPFSSNASHKGLKHFTRRELISLPDPADPL